MLRAVVGFIHINLILFGVHYSQQEENVTEASDIESKLDWDVWCKYQPNAYDCTGGGLTLPRFYYDTKMEDCKTAKFGKCKFNVNQFSSITACHDVCRDAGLRQITLNLTEKTYCRFQPDFGNCNDYYPMWYFDLTIRACKGFSYSGCGGNHNRFPNAQICNAVCGGAIVYN